MSDSYAKYKEDLAEYIHLCKLLKEYQQQLIYPHLEQLKQDPRIIWKDYHYQLKK